MAVVQISRIQVRRGQKGTSGMPQLASGELGWAVDTQELFIGNGSVAEGAPYVGNSKILTTNDNILDLFDQYQYKKNDPTIQTGSDANYPVLRTIQARLDERVSVADFGCVGDDGSTDNTAALQRAIDQLYLNPASVGLYQGRYTLELGPGVYTISSTIYIPSYTSIVGAGQGRTVINYTGTGAVFEFINDTSTIGNPSTINTTTYNNQPRHVEMRKMSISITQADVTGLKLNCVRNSVFEDIGIKGIWTNVDAVQSNSIGVALYALSDVVTSENNSFFRVTTSNLTYGFYSKQDISNNVIAGSTLKNLHMGLSFGQGADLTSTGEEYGPRSNSITQSVFADINRQGIKVYHGNGNLSSQNRFKNVGNDNGGNLTPIYGIIEFDEVGNSSIQDNFDRASDLALPNIVYPYVSEVLGSALFNTVSTRTVNLVQVGSSEPPSPLDFVPLFRIPLADSIGYQIEYVYQSQNGARMRSGNIFIAIDKANGNVQLVDDYEYAGDPNDESKLQFKAALVDSDSSGGNDSIQISYVNVSTGDIATMTYTYRALS